MRPRNQNARALLPTLLARQPASKAADLADGLGISLPTLHRLLKESGPAILAAGKGSRARYAARRSLRGAATDIPLYRVDGDGRVSELTRLALVQPEGSLMPLAGSGWPVVDEASRDGWWPGLPYPLYDMRPQGFLGRHFAQAVQTELQLPANPEHWRDDDIVLGLSQRGLDVSGNLILGEAACERWLAASLQPGSVLSGEDVSETYPRLAETAAHAGTGGSSTAGEFPKFTALRERAGMQTPHVLVKFSGSDKSATVRRWSDLLVCEHLALQAVGGMAGHVAARSVIIQAAGRTFLEVERFDRHGLHGRSGLCSLTVLDAAMLGGKTSDWTLLAAGLHRQGWLDGGELECVRRLWWFGRLIANTDMHTGNLAFRPGDTLQTAPVYDMLPMLYAPMPGGEVPERDFRPSLPLPPDREVWLAACRAALGFWRQAAADGRMTAGFREICRVNAERLDQAAERV